MRPVCLTNYSWGSTATTLKLNSAIHNVSKSGLLFMSVMYKPARTGDAKPIDCTARRGIDSTARHPLHGSARRRLHGSRRASTARLGEAPTARLGAASTARPGAASTARLGAASTARLGTASTARLGPALSTFFCRGSNLHRFAPARTFRVRGASCHPWLSSQALTAAR